MDHERENLSRSIPEIVPQASGELEALLATVSAVDSAVVSNLYGYLNAFRVFSNQEFGDIHERIAVELSARKLTEIFKNCFEIISSALTIPKISNEHAVMHLLDRVPGNCSLNS